MADNDHNLTLKRVLNAPLEKVWRAWTDSNELEKWWGPEGVTNPTCVWQAEAGGEIDIVMLAGDELGELAGQEWPMRGKFIEVVPMQKLVFSSQALNGDDPILETRCTVSFEQNGEAKTTLTLEIIVTKTTAASAGPLAGMEMGWTQSLDKLESQVVGD